MFRLRNWYAGLLEEEMIGYGECYDNPKFPQGFEIHTSCILKIEVDESGRRLKLFTRSGSCYAADFADIHPHQRALESTDEALQKWGIAYDLGEWLTLRNECEEKTKKWIRKMLKSGELYVKMAGGWSVSEAYFKTGEEEVVPVPVSRHISMFSDDSILVTGWGLCDWRIFPMGSTVEPYHWSDGLEAVHIDNAGDSFEFKGSRRNILCKGKEITVISSGEYTGEMLISPDMVNGKSLFRSGTEGDGK